jgi:transposase
LSKEHSSNFTQEQYELLSDLLPAAKLGGRPRSRDWWEISNAILYVLVEGGQWQALPGNLPPWPTTYGHNWR